MNKVKRAFQEWVDFMKKVGPMGDSPMHLRTDEFLELRNKIRAELDQLDKDDENFFMGED